LKKRSIGLVSLQIVSQFAGAHDRLLCQQTGRSIDTIIDNNVEAVLSVDAPALAAPTTATHPHRKHTGLAVSDG
jgi:hypothetical protein